MKEVHSLLRFDMKKIYFLVFMLLPLKAYAHCPLCTAGAAGAALFAKWLGMSVLSVGVFIGAFAAALGAWVSRYFPKKFKWFVIVGSFLLTIVPLAPIMTDYSSIYISWGGVYGGIFNRTYLVNLFIAGSIIGGLVIMVSPRLSGYLSKLRKGKTFPYQGILLTFAILILLALIFQIL